jgi:cell division protein FtsB
MESDHYQDSVLESKIDALTGLVRWHEEDLKNWREHHNTKFFHSFGVGLGVIIVVLAALGISGFYGIKNANNSAFAKIDKLQRSVSDTTIENGTVSEFRKFIVEEKPNMETRLAQLEADNESLKEERETLQADVNELRSQLSGKARPKSPSLVSLRRSHSANGGTARPGP